MSDVLRMHNKFTLEIKIKTQEELDFLYGLALNHGVYSETVQTSDNEFIISIVCNSPITFIFIGSAMIQYYAGV